MKRITQVSNAKRARRGLEAHGWELRTFGVQSTLFWAAYTRDREGGREYLKVYVK